MLNHIFEKSKAVIKYKIEPAQHLKYSNRRWFSFLLICLLMMSRACARCQDWLIWQQVDQERGHDSLLTGTGNQCLSRSVRMCFEVRGLSARPEQVKYIYTHTSITAPVHWTGLLLLLCHLTSGIDWIEIAVLTIGYYVFMDISTRYRYRVVPCPPAHTFFFINIRVTVDRAEQGKQNLKYNVWRNNWFVIK